MTLEYEKLTPDLEKMALTTARRAQLRRERINQALATIRQYRTEWAAIRQALAMAEERKDPKFYRSARPLNEDEPLDTAVSPPAPPSTATIIAADGSQIMPDRHAAHLYYLINVGGVVYYHGNGRAPETFSQPKIFYPENDDTLDDFNTNSGAINIERDLEEIGTLARQTVSNRHEDGPLLSILDQRLLYWPIGTAGVANNAAVTQWGADMTTIRKAGALLAGYIDRPGTSGVMTLLASLTAVSETAVSDSEFDWKSLGKRQATQGLIDADLFSHLLGPGQRSKIFVYVSPPNDTFSQQDPANEICFFFLNPGTSIARVDMPVWVAKDAAAVAAVHSLIVDQCRMLGDYPYVLARADEMAVVGRQDANELNFMIDVIMERHGIREAMTAKQSSKEVARGGRTRHEGF